MLFLGDLVTHPIHTQHKWMEIDHTFQRTLYVSLNGKEYLKWQKKS